MAATTGPIQRQQNLDVPNTLTAQTKYFVIQHPTKEDKQLVHAAVESNRHLVLYTNSITFDFFEWTKELILPDYFWDLVRIYPTMSIHIQLTPVDNFGRFTYSIDVFRRRILIKRKGFLSRQKVNCLILGERADIARLQEVR